MGGERTLYVVMGTTGEYSDRTEWPVRAFLDETKAADLVLRAEAEARQLAYRSDHSRKSAADPNFRMDYTGTEYYIMPVPLDEEVQEAIAHAHAEHIRSIEL